MKNTSATDKKLAELRAQVRAMETGPYFPGVMDRIHALYDEIAEACKCWK